MEFRKNDNDKSYPITPKKVRESGDINVNVNIDTDSDDLDSFANEKKAESLDYFDYDEYDVDWHEERDNAQVVVTRKFDDKVVYENFDPNSIREMIEDGFVKNFGDDKSLLDYLNSLGIIKHSDIYNLQEKAIKEYFNDFNYSFIKSLFEKGDSNIRSPEVDTVKLDDFDPDYGGEEDSEKLIQVMYIGTQQHIYSDQLPGMTSEIKDEVFNDYFLQGKGDDIVKKHLGDDYTLYVRDEDVFFVRGL